MLKLVNAFGIELSEVKEKGIPLLVKWRNDPKVHSYMEDTRKVNENKMKFWLRKIKPSKSDFCYINYPQA